MSTQDKDIYQEYEKLLVERDKLVCAANHIHVVYTKEFGELLQQIYVTRLKVVRKKKMISYCHKILKKGGKLDVNAMNDHIDHETASYYQKLKDMQDEKLECDLSDWNKENIIEMEQKMKKCRELEQMRQEIHVRLAKEWAERKPDKAEIEAGMAELEKEIHDILTNPPYIYKEILKDPRAVASKMLELEVELSEYQEYDHELRELLDDLVSQINGES